MTCGFMTNPEGEQVRVGETAPPRPHSPKAPPPPSRPEPLTTQPSDSIPVFNGTGRIIEGLSVCELKDAPPGTWFMMPPSVGRTFDIAMSRDMFERLSKSVFGADLTGYRKQKEEDQI